MNNTSQNTMKVDNELHRDRPLYVHAFIPDFTLDTVWRVPVELKSHHTLQQFLDRFSKAGEELETTGLAGLLFKTRRWIGRVLRWDEKPVQDRLVRGSLRERYARREGLDLQDLPSPGEGYFVPVYQLQNEFLSEIENKTVHAALHFSRVAREDGTWEIYLAIYAKPKGIVGRLYLAIVRPFRHWIVYPSMMSAVKKDWDAHLLHLESIDEERVQSSNHRSGTSIRS